MSDKSRCPRCGLKDVVTESHHQHKIESNIRVYAAGDYIHDKCTFCGWYSRYTWTKGGMSHEGSKALTSKARLKLNRQIREHFKLKDRTTTRKRAREYILG